MQIENNRENRWQIELKSETLTLTLEVKGRGTYLVRASMPLPVRGTRLRRRSPDFTAQRSRRLAAPGRRGRARGARELGSVHGRLDGGALTLRRAHAPARKPRWRRPACSARPPWPAVVAAVSWREKGRERMNPRVRGPPPSPVLFARRARAAVGFRSDGEGATRR